MVLIVNVVNLITKVANYFQSAMKKEEKKH